MPIVRLEINISAPIERVFDLCRSVEVHVRSTAQTQEKAVSGVASGLLGLGDTVTWEATHLGFRQQLTSQITVCEPPDFFQDQMLRGAFSAFTHDHYFSAGNGVTLVKDRFEFESPFGLIGVLVDRVFLAEYMRQFLKMRLEVVKQIAESDEWRKYLDA